MQRSSVLKVFTYLESNPIIDIQKTATALEISYNTLSKVVSILVDDGILEQTDDRAYFVLNLSTILCFSVLSIYKVQHQHDH